MRLGVLGGTFDPVHLGHLILAHCAAVQLRLDKVMFIPAGDPWRKASRTVSPARERLEMVRLAVQGDGRFDVNDCEIEREGPTYTVDTLKMLRAELAAGSELYFLVGEDALDDMPYWRDPQGMLAVARLAVAPRMPTRTPPPPAHEGQGLEPPDFDRIDMPYIAISSTDLRERARRGESLRYLVPDAVDDYIRRRRLYRQAKPASESSF